MESLTRRGRQEEVFGDRGTTAGSQLLDSRWEKREKKEEKEVGRKYLSSEVREERMNSMNIRGSPLLVGRDSELVQQKENSDKRYIGIL